MSEKDNKWLPVERATKKERNVLSTEEISGKLPIKRELLESPEGIIQKFKAKSIQRKAAIELMKTWYGAQLEVATIQIKKAAEIKNKETLLDAERFLSVLDKRHLEFLMELDIKNIAERQLALVALVEQTSKILANILTKDWPPSMLNQTLAAINTLHQRFFEKVMEE